MRPITRYSTLVAARQAAAYLIEHGIQARALPTVDAFNPGAVVEIVNPDLAGQARSLLDKFDLHKPEYLQPLEDQALPDLSKLPPEFAPDCPACRAPLPLDAMLIRCQSCGGPVNVVDRIVELHGPEALQDCYVPDAADGLVEMTDEQVSRLLLDCRACQYSLSGLPVTGNCPECGTRYNKRWMLDV
jgi:Zn finger protein HypA/HybF involved in hydrogenase expression